MKCVNCGEEAIGFIGLTTTKQEPFCEKCINEMEDER